MRGRERELCVVWYFQLNWKAIPSQILLPNQFNWQGSRFRKTTLVRPQYINDMQIPCLNHSFPLLQNRDRKLKQKISDDGKFWPYKSKLSLNKKTSRKIQKIDSGKNNATMHKKLSVNKTFSLYVNISFLNSSFVAICDTANEPV